MNTTFILNTTVTYKDVDRDETLLLPSFFGFLQEAAIKHANQFDLGTRAMETRGESWVLNRMAATFHRNPRHEETLRVETWSSGIHGFRGYREYRLYANNELAASVSSLWIYLAVKTRSLVRVPLDIAANFPARPDDVHEPSLDRLQVAPPGPSAPTFPIGIRFSDIDGNGHVNNTAYFDYLQTALTRGGLPARPKSLQIKFAKEIRPELESVNVCLESRGPITAFSICDSTTVYAQGALT